MLIVLTACGATAEQTDPGTHTGLAGRSFTSNSVTVGGEPFTLVAGTQLHLTFTDEAITAQAGYNTMSGIATTNDDVLRLSDGLATTEMGCDAQLMKQDEWYADILMASPTVAVDGDVITLSSKDSVVMMTEEP